MVLLSYPPSSLAPDAALQSLISVSRTRLARHIMSLNANSDRVLFHYNGHGVPKPTANGKIWVLNKSGINTIWYQSAVVDWLRVMPTGNGEPERPLIVHVGRLGVEKSLDLLKREDLEKLFSGMPAVFTGTLGGEELSQAYASGDVFKLSFLGHWDIYKWSGSKMNKLEKPWYQARTNSNFLGREMACHVTLGRDKAKVISYRIIGLAGKLAFKITDSHGGLVAEVTQKQLSSGVVLGDDVLSLVVEPQTDHSLVMALVTVYGLMTDKI
ncbi:hypothetical protein TEA_029172 [Camellia sinensis var. sinensis]|uniref:Raptor N-terminal CASPase-like domain-containing protein n=1 Tax=Camellia sinensis var. sinensis TaxID=542762 RepID=A0A4V3WJM1_CAMSN|nr:hypothetical protein TEA_029172 [Camellia sinensis var. sinensis]